MIRSRSYVLSAAVETNNTMTELQDPLIIDGIRYQSRLLVGTGKYKDMEETDAAISASGAEIVTVAVRRVNLTDRSQPMLVDYVSPEEFTFLPNDVKIFLEKAL